MRKASENLAEIQARIAAVLDEYEWHGARSQAHLWIHGADDALVEAAASLPGNERRVLSETRQDAASPSGTGGARIKVCAFGRIVPRSEAA